MSSFGIRSGQGAIGFLPSSLRFMFRLTLDVHMMGLSASGKSVKFTTLLPPAVPSMAVCASIRLYPHRGVVSIKPCMSLCSRTSSLHDGGTTYWMSWYSSCYTQSVQLSQSAHVLKTYLLQEFQPSIYRRPSGQAYHALVVVEIVHLDIDAYT